MSGSIVANSRAALCATLSNKGAYSYEAPGPSAACSPRFALTPVFFVRFSEHKDINPDFTRKSGTSQLLDEIASTADLPDVAYVAHSSWEDFFSHNASRVAPMLTAALEFYRALPLFRVPVQVSTASAGELAEVRGLAAYNASVQCFLLWSRSKAVQKVDLAIDLMDRPAASTPQTIQLYTLGPKLASWTPLQSAPLPPPPTTELTVKGIYLKPFGVVSACVERGDNDSEADTPGSLTGALYARHDVLVPRAPSPQVKPAGLGHYDVWDSAIIVAVGSSGSEVEGLAGEAVGLAGVVLRSLPTTRSFALGTTFALQANQGILAALRVDYLNGSWPILSLLFSSTLADPTKMGSGAAAAWPPAARTLSTFHLPAFDAAGHANLTLPLGSLAPLGWANADASARRVRISLLLCHQEPLTTSAATLRARFTSASQGGGWF